jgi:hypothetical protein
MRDIGMRWVLAGVVMATVLLAAGDVAGQRRPRRPPRGRFPPPASPAFRRPGRAFPELGLRGGYDFRSSTGSIGADLRLPVGPRGGLALAPSGDLFFNTPGHDWQTNLDAELRVPRNGLYGGGGAALLHHQFDPAGERETRWGWNLFAGLEPSFPPVRPFVETRWTFQGQHFSAFRLLGGIHVPIGRRARARGRG